jgi:hypothetical protein
MHRDRGTLRNHVIALWINWRDPPRTVSPKREGPQTPRRDPSEVADQLRRLAHNGWSRGMAALELDIDASRAWRLSRDFAINWNVRGKSIKECIGRHAVDLGPQGVGRPKAVQIAGACGEWPSLS